MRWLFVAVSFLALLATCAPAQIRNVQLQGATATQAVISFDVPDPANCSVQVSIDPNFGSTVNDTNASLFPGSQNCNRDSSSISGSRVTFVAGARAARAGSDGAFYSRALEANRVHYYRITAGPDVFTCDPAKDCIKTANPAFGNTFPEPPPFDAAAPYHYAWPTIRPGLDRGTSFVDPITGIPAIPISGPSQGTNNLGLVVNTAQATRAFDAAGNGSWTDLANGATLDNQVASNAAANQDALFVRFTPWCVAGGTVLVSPAGTTPFGCGLGQGTWGSVGGDQPYFVSIDDLQVQVALSGTGATNQAQIALTVDGVHPATDWQTLSVASTNGNIHFPADANFPATLKGAGNKQTVFGYWFSNQAQNLLTRPDMQPHTGTVSVDAAGNVSWISGEKFRVSSLGAGSRIVLSTGPNPISNAISGAGGAVRVTIANHGYAPGDSFFVIGLKGNSNNTDILRSGVYQINVINANTFDLLGTTFPVGVVFSSGSGYRELFYTIAAANSPNSLTISSPPAAGTYQYMIWNVGVLVRKASAVSGILRVDGATYSDYESAAAQMPLSGLVDVCAVNTVTDSHGTVLRPCMFAESFEHLLYAIEETTGKARFLGAVDPLGCFTGLCAAGVNNHANDYRNFGIQSLGSTFSKDPRHWLGGGVDTAGNFVIVDLSYNPTGTASCANDWQEITPANCPTYPKNNNVVEKNVTPKVDPQGKDRTPVRQMVNYNAAQMLLHPEIPVFDPARWSVTVGGVPTDQTKGWFAVQFAAQNFMGWIGFFDPLSDFNLVAMNNSYSSYNCRYCGTHGAFSLDGYELNSVVLLPVGSGPGAGRFVLQSTTSTNNTTQNVCSGITDPNFTIFNGQARCFDLALAGLDPCHDTPNLATEINPMYQGCTWHAGWTSMTRMNVMVGDLLDDTNDAGEMFRVVKVNGNTITVIRGYGTPSVTVGQNARQSSLQVHNAPWLLREYCSGTSGNNGGQSWFDLNTDPRGIRAIADYPAYITGHLDFWTTGVFAETNQYRIASSIGTMVNAPMSFSANQEGPFGGYLSGGFPWVQTHAGVSRDLNNPYYTIDKNPYSSVGGASNTLWNQTANQVTGALWHIAAANVQKDPATPWPSGIKSVPYVMWSGGYLLQDVSGPASALTGNAADNWKFCVVYKAGECAAASVIGDVYVNIPQTAHDGKCGPWDYARNICGTTLDHIAGGLNQYYFSGIPSGQGLNITDGRTYRRLGGLFNRLNFESVFSSGHGSFGGQWAFGHSDFYGGGLRNDLFLAKLPPTPPSDHIARNNFVDVPVVLGANAAPKARIRFGYADNGPVNAFYCSYNRKEVCYTNPNRTAANPYFFQSDGGQVFQNCAAGCTIQIPAISGRVVYYVIERLDASGNIVAAGNVTAQAVP